MKRITVATMVVVLAGSLQMMGQTTSTTPTSTAPRPKHTTNAPPGSGVKEKDKAAGETAQTTSTTQGGAANGQTSERAGHTLSATPGNAYNGQAVAGGLRCMGEERRPCTEGEVRDMVRGMGEKREEHPVLANINILSLESPEGALKCEQDDGKPCTMEEVRTLNEHVAAPLRLTVSYNGSHSNTANSAYKSTGASAEK